VIDETIGVERESRKGKVKGKEGSVKKTDVQMDRRTLKDSQSTPGPPRQ
jgi:GTPase Era involved in 16S rRNA processing